MTQPEQLALTLFDPPEPDCQPPTLAGLDLVLVARHAVKIIRQTDCPVDERWSLLRAVVGWREDEA